MKERRERERETMGPMEWKIGTCVKVSHNHPRKRYRGWTGRVLRWIDDGSDLGAYLVGLDFGKNIEFPTELLFYGGGGVKAHRPMRRRRRTSEV